MTTGPDISLVHVLAVEIERVRKEVIPEYQTTASARFAAALMGGTITRAEQAIKAADHEGMKTALEALRGCGV